MKYKKNLVSLIVPIYNSEKFLDKCLTSIINQTYENIEIILINDESKDKSLSICEKYKKTDQRIKIIDKLNEGCAMARNSGLDIASGDFICFIDSDDYIDKDYVKILLENAIKSFADVVECQSYRILNNKKEMAFDLPDYVNCNSYEISKAFIEKVYFANYLWNKIFKKEVIGNLRLINLYQSEDHEFLSRVYLNCKKKVNIPNILYYYVTHDSSCCAGAFSQKRMAVIYAEEIVYKTYEENKYYDLRNYVAFRIIVFVFDFYNKAKNLSKSERQSIRKELKIIFKKYYKTSLKSNVRTGGIPVTNEYKFIKFVQYYLFLIFPPLSIVFTNILLKNKKKKG